MPTLLEWTSSAKPEFPRYGRTHFKRVKWISVVVTGRAWLPRFYIAHTAGRDQVKLMLHEHDVKWVK